VLAQILPEILSENNGVYPLKTQESKKQKAGKKCKKIDD